MAKDPRAVVEQLLRSGRKFEDAPDGPIIERYTPLGLSQIIDRELNRCAVMGWDKITIHLDQVDAQMLAMDLRKIALLR